MAEAALWRVLLQVEVDAGLPQSPVVRRVQQRLAELDSMTMTSDQRRDDSPPQARPAGNPETDLLGGLQNAMALLREWDNLAAGNHGGSLPRSAADDHDTGEKRSR